MGEIKHNQLESTQAYMSMGAYGHKRPEPVESDPEYPDYDYMIADLVDDYEQDLRGMDEEKIKELWYDRHGQ